MIRWQLSPSSLVRSTAYSLVEYWCIAQCGPLKQFIAWKDEEERVRGFGDQRSEEDDR